MRGMGILALLALLHCTSSLLLPSREPEDGGATPATWHQEATQGRLPDQKTQRRLQDQKPLPLVRFAAEWEHRREKEPHMDKPLPTGLQVVFAMPLKDDAKSDDYWQVVTETWARQRGVCLLGKELEQQEGCQAYVVRVVANSEGWQPNMDLIGDATRPPAPKFYGHSFESHGVLRLNMTENMRRGKTFRLLQTLAKSVTWATHIAKVDVDAYPYMYRLMSSLASHQSCGAGKFQYAGIPIYLKHAHKNCRIRPISANVTKSCVASMGDDCDMPECAYFNNGGLYVLSADLARHITQPGGPFERYCCEGPEDSTVGGSIFFHVKECVASWSLLGAVHHTTGEGGATIRPELAE